jgi:hypothetical protein
VGDRRRETEVEEAERYQMMINYIQRGKWNPALYSQRKVLKEKCVRLPPCQLLSQLISPNTGLLARK